MESNTLIELFNETRFDSTNFKEFCSLFDVLPFAIYWKDNDGKYVGRNRYTSEIMVFAEFESQVNLEFSKQKTDFDLFDEDTARTFRENDIIALNKPEIAHHFVESTRLPTGELIEQVSVKRCILGHNSQSIGTLGCTINLHKVTYPDKPLGEMVKESHLVKLRQVIIEFMASTDGHQYQLISAILLKIMNFYPHSHELRKLLILTSRELDCLCLLLKGLSAKQIGQILNVSFRTVEIHLTNVKDKLYLPYKLDVISWFWSMLSQL